MKQVLTDSYLDTLPYVVARRKDGRYVVVDNQLRVASSHHVFYLDALATAAELNKEVGN